MPKCNSMGYGKKREKEKKGKISMPKGMREKKCMPKSMKKRKEKKKERNKDSPYFQIKMHSFKKREIHDSKQYQKYLELGLY